MLFHLFGQQCNVGTTQTTPEHQGMGLLGVRVGNSAQDDCLLEIFDNTVIALVKEQTSFDKCWIHGEHKTRACNKATIFVLYYCL